MKAKGNARLLTMYDGARMLGVIEEPAAWRAMPMAI
jgi:hypothetical protein